MSVRFCEETQVVCRLALWLTHCVYHNIVYLIVVGLKITVCGAFMLLLLREGWMDGGEGRRLFSNNFSVV